MVGTFTRWADAVSVERVASPAVLTTTFDTGSPSVLDLPQDADTPRPASPRAAPPTRARGIAKDGPMGPTIVARDLFKYYGSPRNPTPIVRGVSLTVAHGETVYLIGPSGSGKTTLLSILGCILTPDQGQVELLGQDVARLGSEELTDFRRRHLGFIFQTFNLFPTLSALDNVRLALALRGVGRRESRTRAADLLGQVGLGKVLRSRPARLSTGECQRVAIARALAGDPSILLADEPTASLDAENGQSVMGMLSGLARDRGLTLVIVTHDNRIAPFADRTLRLEDGRLIRPEVAAPGAHPHVPHGRRREEIVA
jgi:putative ABC transport system ATP-binding protein